MTNLNCTEIEELDTILETFAEKQAYLDYIDADMKAFIEVKAEAIGFDVVSL